MTNHIGPSCGVSLVGLRTCDRAGRAFPTRDGSWPRPYVLALHPARQTLPAPIHTTPPSTPLTLPFLPPSFLAASAARCPPHPSAPRPLYHQSRPPRGSRSSPPPPPASCPIRRTPSSIRTRCTSNILTGEWAPAVLGLENTR